MSKKELLKYIKSHNMMQLATSSKNKPWVCTVYYAFDGKNIYFISNPSRRHCKDIKNNEHVACAITDTAQKVTDKKIGVQIQGIASQVTSEKETLHILELWNNANPGFERFINIDNLRSGKMGSRPYIIKPAEIKFFNEKLYGSDGARIFRV